MKYSPFGFRPDFKIPTISFPEGSIIKKRSCASSVAPFKVIFEVTIPNGEIFKVIPCGPDARGIFSRNEILVSAGIELPEGGSDAEAPE